ncbi:hypothetical protein SLS62_005982 [Diatrype stigma]|uniref:Uncharacterized protein n=1 Tax=Diatrype stigma TaxID=117547 RepID=A0AAN9UTU5_9PEZI
MDIITMDTYCTRMHLPPGQPSELGRVAAHAALRTSSLLRPSAPRIQFASKTATAACQRRLLPIQQHQCYAGPPSFWSSLGRERQASELETEVKKPQMDRYYEDDVVQDIDLEIADLGRKSEPDTTTIVEMPPKPTVRLVPRLGRTVQVSRNVDVARSFKLLGVQMTQNKVRSDFQRQKFHERPGLKRKRLHSERWQRRFKLGFKETVNRVKELAKQGW